MRKQLDGSTHSSRVPREVRSAVVPDDVLFFGREGGLMRTIIRSAVAARNLSSVVEQKLAGDITE